MTTPTGDGWIFTIRQSLQDGAQQELYLAVAQVRQGANLTQGTPQLEAAIQKYHPAEAEFYFELAEAYSKSGKPEKAIDMFEQTIRRKPDFWPAATRSGRNARALRATSASERNASEGVWR